MVRVGRALGVAGSPLGRASGRAWAGSPRPRPGPGRTGGWPLRGAGAAERSGTEECGVCGVWRRSGGVLALGERCGGRERGRSGGRDSGVRLEVRGSPVGGGRAVLSADGARRGPAAARLQVGLAGFRETRRRQREGEAVQFRGSLPGLRRGVPIVSHSQSWFRLLWRS